MGLSSTKCKYCVRTYGVKEHLERHEKQCKERFEARERRKKLDKKLFGDK